MSNLNQVQRRAVWAGWMSANTQPVALVKADLYAAVEGIDDWLDSHGASLHAAIPQPARSALSDAQQRRLLLLIVLARFEEDV